MKKTDFQTVRYELIDHFSISGVQDKISLKLVRNELQPTSENGEYILKPVPELNVPKLQNDIPANEHLTMQIARQIFKIKTAENALITFQDEEFAYITKRFDRNNKEKLRQEDFCQLTEKSPESHGKNFKYDGSYEKLGNVIKRFCAASKIEIEKLFKLILFNYVFGNGDSHLKNFSLIETQNEDFILSPAYDLTNTNIHFPNESRMALEMFDDFESKFYRNNGFSGKEDFLKLAEFYEIKEKRAIKMIREFPEKKESVNKLIEASFLSEKAKEKYMIVFHDRLKAIS
ncbi:MAG: HipA domain-containing protein [Candidatus Cloacimonetes bacterium]|nr:HipA domain-containing protein [Candidatus Cloacimonadota bacterium]MCF7813423.1 HipA domain-containing protein [Candidatus Cloacimonadota bacterium]MCF7867716.1 HipA domain-containing protein [Candidatus Cloacimonadota bacterium]